MTLEIPQLRCAAFGMTAFFGRGGCRDGAPPSKSTSRPAISFPQRPKAVTRLQTNAYPPLDDEPRITEIRRRSPSPHLCSSAPSAVSDSLPISQSNFARVCNLVTTLWPIGGSGRQLENVAPSLDFPALLLKVSRSKVSGQALR